MPELTPEQIDELRSFDSPTICNAIERFNVRPRTEGYAGPHIRCVIPYSRPMVGYACTVKISAIEPPTDEQKELVFAFYESLTKTAAPSIAVVQDVDEMPIGSFWGEVNATVCKSLGCVGTITDGGVRDIDEVRNVGFGYHARHVLVSHAYIHVVEQNVPVEIDGLTVRPGDLLHADQHGVVLIPKEVATRLADACRKAQYAEEPLINGCRERGLQNVTVQDIRNWRKLMDQRRTE